jgi:hypothetical protein
LASVEQLRQRFLQQRRLGVTYLTTGLNEAAISYPFTSYRQRRAIASRSGF